MPCLRKLSCLRHGTCFANAILAALLFFCAVAKAQDPEQSPDALHPPRLISIDAVESPDNRTDRNKDSNKVDSSKVQSVTFTLTVDRTGRVTEATLVDGDPALGDLAKPAVLEARFAPARRGETAIDAIINFTFEFSPPTAPAPSSDLTAPVDATPSPTPAPPTVDEDVPDFGASAHVEIPEHEKRLRSSEAVDVVDLRQERSSAADVGRLLSRQQGANVQRAGGLGSATTLRMAGFGANRIRYFLDGVPLHYMGFGQDIGNLPTGLIERIEIYRGVVPIRYGADALGGAIDVRTDRLVDGTDGAVSYQLGSFDTHRANAAVSHVDRTGGWFIRSDAFFDRAENNYPVNVELTDNRGQIREVELGLSNADYAAEGVGVEVGILDKPIAERLSLRGFFTRHERGVPHNITMTVPYGRVRQSNHAAGAVARYDHTLVDDLRLELRTGVTQRNIELQDTGPCAYDWLGQCVVELPQPGEVLNYPVLQSIEQTLAFVRSVLSLELEPEHLLQASLSTTWVGRTGENRALSDDAADPLEGQRSLTDVVAALSYRVRLLDDALEGEVFGKFYTQTSNADELRLDGTFSAADRTTNRFGAGVVTRFELDETAWVKASYELATRLPSPDEIFGDGGFTLANLQLEPEQSHNFNLGLHYKGEAGDWGQLSGELAGFARIAEDLVVLLNTATALRHENLLNARSVGALVGVTWQSPSQYVTLGANATYNDFRNTSADGVYADVEGDRVPNQPYLFANVRAALRVGDVVTPSDSLTLAIHSHYVHSFFRDWESLGRADSKQTVPSQFTHDVSLTYTVETLGHAITTALEVHNLTDQKVYDFVGVQRPGRSAFAKLTLQL